MSGNKPVPGIIPRLTFDDGRIWLTEPEKTPPKPTKKKPGKSK